MYRKHLWLFVLGLLVACSPQVKIHASESNAEELQEVSITEIALVGPLAKRESEISSLAWYGDTLILLPQYPGFDGSSHLYALSKAEIEAYLASDNPAPLSPRPVPFVDSGLSSLIEGFQGFEAIFFVGDRVYLTIEAELAEGMRGYLVAGQIAPNLSEVVMGAEVVTEIVLQGRHENRTDETMFLYDGTLVTLYEVNGVKVNKTPVAHRFDYDLKTRETLSFPNLEYRVTDATVVDDKGRFWVVNFYDPRDKNLYTDTDPLADRFGLGTTHSIYDQVERLVEMRISSTGVNLTDTQPIYLELLSKVPRKWEGIVRFNDGFLLATDKFPVTVLAYVGK